jgi:hypothetical protein
MNDTQLTAIIIGLTGILRTRLPKIDGIIVPAVAVVIGGALSALANPAIWREALFHGVGIALAAVGGMTAIGYAGTKVGEAIGSANAPDTTDATAPGVLPNAPSPAATPATAAPAAATPAATPAIAAPPTTMASSTAPATASTPAAPTDG